VSAVDRATVGVKKDMYDGAGETHATHRQPDKLKVNNKCILLQENIRQHRQAGRLLADFWGKTPKETRLVGGGSSRISVLVVCLADH